MRTSQTTRRAVHLAAALALWALAALAANGLLREPAAALGVPHLVAPARDYLAAASDRSVKFLVALSVAKTGLAVIEGSTANFSLVVGASIQVGDIVKALYDAVDYAWTAVLFGAAMVFALRQLLEAGFFVGQFTLALALLSAGALLIARGWGEGPLRMRVVDRLSTWAATTTVLLWIGFPFGLVCAAATSTAVTAPSLEAARVEVQTLSRATDLQSDASAGGIRERIDRIRTYLIHKADDVTRALGTIIAGYVLDCVVFPAAFGALIVGLAKRLVGIR
jgi:hypothetical protein